MGLEAAPSNERLQEFVRCAAVELESQGYFATRALSIDPRWRNGSIYVFGLDTLRKRAVQRRFLQPVVGQPCSRAERLSGRDLRRPGCGERRRCVRGNLPVLLDTQSCHRDAAAQGDFRQEVVAYGLPILVGSGYYHPDEGP